MIVSFTFFCTYSDSKKSGELIKVVNNGTKIFFNIWWTIMTQKYWLYIIARIFLTFYILLLLGI